MCLMDNSSWLKELIDKTEHRKKEKFSYLSYLKSKVSIKKLLVTLWVVILFSSSIRIPLPIRNYFKSIFSNPYFS